MLCSVTIGTQVFRVYQNLFTVHPCIEEKPLFLRTLEDITLNEVGLTATFECEVSLEGLKAEWRKANKPVKASGRISIVADKKIHRLIISDVTDEDEGQYTVVFKEQDLQSTASLAVKGFETISVPKYGVNICISYSLM